MIFRVYVNLLEGNPQENFLDNQSLQKIIFWRTIKDSAWSGERPKAPWGVLVFSPGLPSLRRLSHGWPACPGGDLDTAGVSSTGRLHRMGHLGYDWVYLTRPGKRLQKTMERSTMLLMGKLTVKVLVCWFIPPIWFDDGLFSHV